MEKSVTANLLDCDQEPTDEALELVMQEVAVEAREKAVKCDRELMREVEEDITAAFSRHGKAHETLPAPQ